LNTQEKGLRKVFGQFTGFLFDRDRSK